MQLFNFFFLIKNVIYMFNKLNFLMICFRLKLSRLNEEMKNSGPGNIDESFNEVVRDFAQLTSSPLHK